ncbi:AraC family transcriptional regulator ligand-binding domain-containing protein [Streptomyces mirabilis]|uniref:AraC family transcriptional regulator ligand-binding domain-containing protein n=1 Tax=Streptomyces mirabilis TaxID=68239 RepID=UPI0036279C8D
MDSDDITVANDCFLRTLVLAEHHHGVPDVGLRVGADVAPGQLGVYDCLFTTAWTLGEGYAASGRYVDLITGVGQYAVVAATERVVRVTFSLAEDEDRGRELAIRTGMSDLLSFPPGERTADRSRGGQPAAARAAQVHHVQRLPRHHPDDVRRHEVHHARQAQFARLRQYPAAPSGGKAGVLGYSDARALRRARRRWAAR